MSLAWNPSPSTNVVSYNVYYGPASGVYNNKISAGGSTNATITGLAPGTTNYIAVTAVNSFGIESPFSNEISYSVTNSAANVPPTLNALANVTINENAGLQTVNLAGISSGAANQVQTLTVTAASSNTGLIPNPTVIYTSPNSTGSLTFTPALDGNGTATITVTVNNNGASNNIVKQSFTVTVNPVNQPPTLNALANVAISQNAGLQTVNLAGISSGATNQVQTLTVTAASSNTGLIPNPTVNYTSPNSTGSLTFTPAVNTNGTATVTVTVNNNGASNNIVKQSFTVTINPSNRPPTLNALANVTINENAGLQTVNLAGISSGAANQVQTLTVTAASSNTGLIPNPTVIYTSPNSTGSLTFTPALDGNGTATITVTVNNNGASNNIVKQSFTVTVNPVNQPPTLNALANVAISQNAGLQTVNLAGISSGATNQVQTLTVTAASSNTGLIPNPTVNYTSPNSTGSLTFTPAVNTNGTATVTVTVNNNGASNNIVKQSFTVTINPSNRPPTLNALANVTINENAGLQTVNLAGISSGATNQVQTLTVTAASSNAGLIPNPTVIYTSPNSTGSLTFTPALDGNGTATITVTVNNNGASNNIVKQSFTVTVNPVNQPPTLNALANVAISQNAGLQTVNLAGISSGATNQVQTLTVTAASSNAGLIPNPTVIYTSPNSTGSLTFTPALNGNGTATITVTVNNNGASNNIVKRSFTVTVNPVNQPPTLNALANVAISQNAGLQTVNLAGISSGATNQLQKLTVTAASSNTGLIPNPTVNYTSPNSTGSLTFTPAVNTNGTATITVTVNNNGASNNIVKQSFTVTVNGLPTLNPISNTGVVIWSGSHTINLTGISSGLANTNQAVTIKATSSNQLIVPTPSVSYASPNSTGVLTFSPLIDLGTAVVSVTVNNGQPSNNLITRSFNVTVLASGSTPPQITTAPANLVALAGQTAAFSVSASGTGPLTYQWLCNSSPVAGATNSTLTLAAVTTQQAGQYTVTVANVLGTANASATLTVNPMLAVALAKSAPPAGQFAVNVNGVTGSKYVVEASSNLVNWSPVVTNIAPFTFVDTNASQFKQRYYRSYNLP